MYQANVPEDARYRVCKEALQCATMLDNAVVIVINGVKGTRYQQLYDEMPGFVTKLRTWGEAELNICADRGFHTQIRS